MPSLLSQIEKVPADSLEFYPNNPRRGDVPAIAASLRENQQYAPIVVQRSTRYILAGNHTLKAARELGWSEIDVVFVDVDDDRARKILLSSNRTGELPGPDGQRYDDDALVELLSYLDGDYAGTGWTEEDVSALIEPPAPPGGNGDPDDAPEPPAEPVSKVGDLWLLGEHRLGCGDSTDPVLWDRILGPERPDLVFTDPPYGIGYVAMRGGAAIANDKDASEALQVTRDALALFHDAGAHFVCCDWRSLTTIIDAMLGAAIEPKACIVWDKQSRVQNLDRYAKQHEFIVYAGPYGGQPTACTDVWTYQRDFEPDHPTPKPVGLIEQALTTASERGAIVADPFGGSGPTLIAAHRTGRIARLCELEPRYVDQICHRFERFTQIKPERVLPDGTAEPVTFT